MQTLLLNQIDLIPPTNSISSANSTAQLEAKLSYENRLLDYRENSSTIPSADAVDEEVEKVILYLRSSKEQTLIQKISSEVSFEPGIINETISYFGSLLSYGKIAVVMWTSQMFQDYYQIDRVIKGLLYIAMYYSEEFESINRMMAVAAISSKSNEVKELAVRVLESNCNLTNYQILISLDVHESWLREYIDDVIKDFKEALCLS